MPTQTDVIIVGGGLAGLVAAAEVADAGKRAIIVEQEGGKVSAGKRSGRSAAYSLSIRLSSGGCASANRMRSRCRIGSDGRLRPAEDIGRLRPMGRSLCRFRRRRKAAMAASKGVRSFPVVAWAERGGGRRDRPRQFGSALSLTWGTGPGVVEPFERRVREPAVARPRHVEIPPSCRCGPINNGDCGGSERRNARADECGARQIELERENRRFRLRAQRHRHLGRHWRQSRAGAPELASAARPAAANDDAGVPAHVDGRMIAIAQAAGAAAHQSRPDVALRRGRAQLGSDLAEPRHPNSAGALLDVVRCARQAFAGAAISRLRYARHARTYRQDRLRYSWFVLTQSIIRKEFALSGSEQNPELPRRAGSLVLTTPAGTRRPAGRSVQEERRRFRRARQSSRSRRRNERLAGEGLLELEAITAEIVARDREIANPFSKDAQIVALRGARNYIGDRLIRVAPPHRILDPAQGPLIAVRLNILTRKTFGGLETDLVGRVFGGCRAYDPGLYAAGEASGFGGGGVHGYRSLEGTFLGGCIFSGRAAGRAAARARLISGPA